MTVDAVPARSSGVTRDRVLWLASLAFCGVLPALVLVLMFVAAIGDGSYAIDFRQLYGAADDILAGASPYPAADALLSASGRPYVYPPLPAIVTLPLTVLPLDLAGLLVMAALVGVALSIPFVLGVRDWRCYGVVLLWPPVLAAIQTGNVTLWLALAAALAWRFRDRIVPVAGSMGVALSVKFLLWPLLLWLVATRRTLSAVLAAAIGAMLLVASWAVIGFDGLRGYPALLRRLEETVGDDAYTISNLAQDLGAPDGIARALWLGVGFGLLVACVFVVRRGDETSAFILALAAALALSPLVWLHYFALLVVVTSIARPRLGLVWFVPVAMFASTGTGDPTPLATSVALGAAGLTIALALRDTRRWGWARHARDKPAMTPAAAS